MNIYQKTIATACLCLAALSIQAQTQVIAHRGYWKAEGSAQNSLASLRKAAEAKVYGSEFDVQMTADGIVVVNHDNTIGSTTISRATYEQIKESKLKNGETLPTLQAYLEEGRKLKDLQLILEIKKNKNKEHEAQAVKTIVKMVKDMGMEKQTEYISFSLNVCEQLVKATNGASEIFYINGDLSPQEAKAKGFTGIDYNFKVFDQHPEWVEEAHRCGLKVNAWATNKEEDLKRMRDLGVDFVTTDHPVEAIRLMKEKS